MSKLIEFEKLIVDEMNRFGLISRGWRHKFDGAKKRLGQCRYGSKVLSFSLPFIVVNEIEVMHGTVLHEIAHALCLPSHGHGPAWKSMAISIGAKPQPCNGDPRVVLPVGPYKFECKCRTYYFHRSNVLGDSVKCIKCKTVGEITNTHIKNIIVTHDNVILERMKQKSSLTVMKELMK